MDGVEKRYSSFEELIKDPQVDVVHINSPIHMHAPQAIAALKAGKHVACTVPAATTVDECRQIVKAAVKSRKNYMMMETAIYTREFLYIRELRDTGRLGHIQFMRWRQDVIRVDPGGGRAAGNASGRKA
jgi:predicted dehydrogenase